MHLHDREDEESRRANPPSSSSETDRICGNHGLGAGVGSCVSSAEVDIKSSLSTIFYSTQAKFYISFQILCISGVRSDRDPRSFADAGHGMSACALVRVALRSHRRGARELRGGGERRCFFPPSESGPIRLASGQQGPVLCLINVKLTTFFNRATYFI